ncbi:MAG: hypothetical protein NC413_07450 [Muribaculum sp.]|nr:hypothetical protein [Muribaculum sp.]
MIQSKLRGDTILWQLQVTMSLEISKLTQMPNENLMQDTDNPIAVAENDMLSDEIEKYKYKQAACRQQGGNCKVYRQGDRVDSQSDK